MCSLGPMIHCPLENLGGNTSFVSVNLELKQKSLGRDAGRTPMFDSCLYHLTSFVVNRPYSKESFRESIWAIQLAGGTSSITTNSRYLNFGVGAYFTIMALGMKTP